MTTINVDLPLSAKTAGYDQEQAQARYARNADLIGLRYNYEKIIGKRRRNGMLKLNDLKPEHKQYVSAYINGMKGVEIAEQFNVSAMTVYRVLGDPLARELIEEFDENFKDEFRAMFPLVADAIREGLESGATGNKLKAVDRWTKVCRFLDGDKDETSEDKTKTVFAARMKFVQLIQDAKRVAGPEATLVEVEVVEQS